MRPVAEANRAELMVTRLTTVLIAVAALVKGVALVPSVLAEPNGYDPVRLVPALVLALGVPLVGGVVAFTGGLKTLRVMNGLTVLGQILIVVTWVFLVKVPGRELDWVMAWLLSSGASIAAAMIAFGVRRGWAVLVTVSVVVPVADLIRFGFDPVVMIDGLFNLGISITFAALLVTVFTSARRLDAKALAAAETATMRSAERALQASRRQADALIHDDILSTLLFAAENNPFLRPAVANQARKALNAIGSLAAPAGATVPVDGAEFQLVIQDATLFADSRARFTHTGTPVDVPPGVAEALLSAFGQALSNSIKHAGSERPVHRSVSVHWVRDAVSIEVHDDGRGFDPDQIQGDRLGIKASILGRMNDLPGGSAQLDSAPGAGSTVTVGWHRPGGQPDLNARSSPRRDDNGFSRRAVWALGSVFLLCQILLCLVRIFTAPNPLPSIVALAALGACVGLLASINFRRPSRPRTSVVVFLLVLTVSMQFFQEHSLIVPRLSSWYILGVAVILLALAFQHRLLMAWLGMVAVSGVVIVATVSQGAADLSSLAVLLRPLTLLSVGTIFLIPLNLVQRRVSLLRAAERDRLAREVFLHISQNEGRNNALLLEQEAGSLLRVLSLGVELHADQVAQCIALEGALRDRSRGHRLTGSGLAEAARAARLRGVDVMLLDDGQNSVLPTQDLAGISDWMSRHLATLETGQFIGRILPPGRGDLATIVTLQGEITTSFSYPAAATAPAPVH